MKKEFNTDLWLKESYFAIADLRGKEYMDRRILSDGLSWGKEPSKTAEEALKFLVANDINTVLDVGCGYARDAYYLAINGINVTGIEYSEMAVKTANEEFQKNLENNDNKIKGNLDVINYDFRYWVPDKKYPAVFSFKTLHQFRNNPDRSSKHFLKDPLAIIKIISKVKECLLPGGFFIFSTFNTNDLNYGAGEFIEGNTWDTRGFRPCTFYNKADILELLRDFEIISIVEDFEEPDKHEPEGKHIHKMLYVIAKKAISNS
jgi:SAM-dependent methyltransferase